MHAVSYARVSLQHPRLILIGPDATMNSALTLSMKTVHLHHFQRTSGLEPSWAKLATWLREDCDC